MRLKDSWGLGEVVKCSRSRAMKSLIEKIVLVVSTAMTNVDHCSARRSSTC